MGYDWGTYNMDYTNKVVGVSSGDNVTITFTASPDTFDDAIHRLANEIADVVISKQKDYGQSNILDAPFTPQVGLVVRLWDKVSRLKNLTERGYKPENESINDTYIDIIGYALLALMVDRGWFTLPLKLEKNEQFNDPALD